MGDRAYHYKYGRAKNLSKEAIKLGSVLLDRLRNQAHIWQPLLLGWGGEKNADLEILQ
jgi:hypothetical protein